METSEQKNEWYQKKWLVTLLCIVFFPIGLYALWKNTIIKKGWKIAITAFFALVVIANLSNKNSGGNNVQPEQNTSSTPVVVTPPQQTAPDIQILQKRIKWNPDVQGAVTIDCVVRNNSNDLKDYVELDASFFDKGGKILGTGMGNTTNFPANSTRTIEIEGMDIDASCSTYKVDIKDGL